MEIYMAKKINITIIENNEKKEISVDEGIQVHTILHHFKTSIDTIYGIKIDNSPLVEEEDSIIKEE